MTLEGVRQLLLKRAVRYAKNRGSTGVIGWCEVHGVNRFHVSDFLNGNRLPPNDLLGALGLE